MSKIVRSIKNVTNGYSPAQKLVRNATSNDSSGPTTADMDSIKGYTYNSQTDFLEVMDMLDRRLNDKGKNWRHIVKSLTVLDFLVRYGSDKCVLWAKDNIYIVKTLTEFIHYDSNDVDQGALIRVKAKELVSLLNDDQRLRAERQDKSSRSDRPDRGNKFGKPTNPQDSRSDPYDSELQKALELSRMTAEEETHRGEDSDDPDLQAALKLSLEEEQLRKQKDQGNLLDLNDDQGFDHQAFFQQQQQQQQSYLQQQQQQAYFNQQQQQQQQQAYLQQQALLQQQQLQQQFDMFGNPIQNPMNTGLYNYQQPQQPQQPNFTGFNYGQQSSNQQKIQPLKTGSKNPFALQSESDATDSSVNNSDSLNSSAQQQSFNQYREQSQPSFNQPQSEPATPLKAQLTSGSRYNDSTHGELNNLLAQGTGIDTFGNTGHSRIPHQYTQTQTFINSSGTGYKQHTNAPVVTGNPFLNTGIPPSNYQQKGKPQVNPAHTGYGFGNSSQQKNGNDQSLIDI